MYIRMSIISIIISSIVVFGYNYFFAPKYAEVDLFSVIGDEQKNIVELIRKGKLEEKDTEKTVRKYLALVEAALKQVSKDERVIIVQKGIILSQAPDITEKVKKRIEALQNAGR